MLMISLFSVKPVLGILLLGPGNILLIITEYSQWFLMVLLCKIVTIIMILMHFFVWRLRMLNTVNNYRNSS